MALGFFTTTSSIWLSCSGMLSGLVGMYCSVFAFSVFAMLSAPTRTVWKNGLVWFLVKTAMVSPSARTSVVSAAAISSGSAK
ncbi:glucan phosphoethanolaminetransferase (alkaline phosphatase superfamily) [Bradyrhizobium sp. LM3.4]